MPNVNLPANAGTPDRALRMLVEEASTNPNFELAITLTVSGSIVTGLMVPGSRWLNSLHANVVAIGTGTHDALTERMRDELAVDALDADQVANDNFIHLADARYVLDGISMIPHSGALWRGRLMAVDGWNIGSLLREQ